MRVRLVGHQRTVPELEEEMGLGDFIYLARIRLGLTQDELSKKAMISRPQLSCIENGKGNPTFGTLVAIVDALDYQICFDKRKI